MKKWWALFPATMYLKQDGEYACASSVQKTIHFTSPSSSNFCFVSLFSAVEARIHTPPVSSLIAVERPPMGTMPSMKGLSGSV